jgi:magnesium chelatase subunit I
MVYIPTVTDAQDRRVILKNVLAFDHARFLQGQGQPVPLIDTARMQDEQQRNALEQARQRFYTVEVSEQIEEQCIAIALKFDAEGHRGDYLMALAARAYAARDNQPCVEPAHLQAVARLVLQHRHPSVAHGGRGLWSKEDDALLQDILTAVTSAP